MKKSILLAILILLLTGCGSSQIEIDGVKYDPAATAITLAPGTTVQHYEAVKAALPECDISWEVPFQGNTVNPKNLVELEIDSLAEEDIPLFAYFTDLQTVDATALSDPAMAVKLQEAYPQLEVFYNVEICGETYPSDTKKLKLETAGASQLENLKYLPDLDSVHIDDPQGDPAELTALAENYPITWEKEYFGYLFHSSVTEMDFSQEENLVFDDVQAMEEGLLWFPDLELVYFGDVTVDNDTMAEYRTRQEENYKVVWNVRLNHRINIRSDATYFMPRKFYMTVIDRDLVNLKYFNDMVTVDLGHMNIFNCEWLAGMPKLQYLILADTPMKSIEPVANCKELIYFEIFDTPVKDFSPLLECTKLRDLNMCWTDGDPEVIAQLTWLERLWWWGTLTRPSLTDEEKAMITDAMPGCEVVFRTTTSTGGGWREGELYYKMRDNLGMEYMK